MQRRRLAAHPSEAQQAAAVAKYVKETDGKLNAGVKDRLELQKGPPAASFQQLNPEKRIQTLEL